MAKYLYNGIELPTLPEWDKSIYPYAVIYSEDNVNYWLYIFSEYNGVADYTSIDAGYSFNIQLPSKWAKFTNSGDTWSEFTDSTNARMIGGVKNCFIWTSVDIYYGDTIVYQATEPTPIVEAYSAHLHNGTWQKGTFYKRLNGAWVKHQAYRRVNGAWVKVKE